MARVVWPGDSDTVKVKAVLDQIESEFAAGRMIVGPGDTVYGCLCPATDEGYEFLSRVKKRSGPFIHLMGSLEAALFQVKNPSASLRKQLAGVWPGPVTVVVPAANQARGDTVALRVPDDAFLQAVLGRRQPLLSTSANKAGGVPAVDGISAELAFPEFLVVDAGPSRTAQPSTLVDLTRGKPVVLRQGQGDPGPLLSQP